MSASLALLSSSLLSLASALVPLAMGVIGCTGRAGGAPDTAPAAAALPFQSATDLGGILEDWHRAAAASDEQAYFDRMTDDAIFIGTDATERWDVAAFRAYAHPRFAAGKGWVMHATARNIVFSADRRTAWFDEALEATNLGPARGSGVLVQGTDGRYRIAHYVLSISVPNERFAAVKDLLAQP